MDRPISVLHVDDNPSITELTTTFLEREDDRFTVETATSAGEGMERINDRPPDCVISDYNMPGLDGLEFLQAVREDNPGLPFILYTGKGSEAVASEAIACDVTDYLQKGSESEQYELLANRILNAVQSRRETQRADRQDQLMRLTEFAGDTGGFELDIETGEIFMTDGARRINEIPAQAELRLNEAIDLYHPEDREEIRQTIDRARQTGEQTHGTWRTQPQDGEERLLDVTFTPANTDDDTEILRGAIQDITEQRERQQELKQIETLFEHAHDALFLVHVGEKCTLERVNPAIEDATGVPPSEVQGQTPQELFGEQQGAAVEAKYRECIERRELLDYDEQLSFGGQLTYWETKIAPVVIDDTVEYIAGSTRDVTEQKERQQELDTERRFIQQALDSLDDLFYVIDLDGHLQQWNERVTEVTGHPDSELDGLKISDHLPEDEHDKLWDAIEKTRQEGTATLETELLTTRGESIPYEFTVGCLTAEDGTPTGLVGVGRDLTERRQRERRFQALVEESNDVISVVDADGRYQYQSPSLESVLGHDPEETVGDMVWEYIHPDDRETVIEEFEAWVQNLDRTSGGIEYRARHGDGSWRWMEAHGNHQLNNTALDGYVINSRNITARKRDEQQLEKREQILRKLHEATREFYPPGDDTEIAEFLESFLSSAFDFPYVSVKQFDEEENCLNPAIKSSAFTDEPETLGRIEPGPNPIWRAYEQGEPQTFDMQQHADILDSTDMSVDQVLAFPVGDFGVIIVCAPDEDQIDEVARELLEVVAATAESAFERLRAAETHTDIATELSTRQDKVEELTTVTETLQALQESLRAKETTDALDESVCDNLTRTDLIDFAWIGRPEGAETNLQPVTWSGQESGYLNEVDLDSESLPAQRTVDEHEQCSIPDIGAHATDTDWAKHALTAGFRSAFTIPLVYDGVLYGVVSAYSTEEEAFDKIYRNLVTNAGSMLVNYNRTLEHRYEETSQKFTILEFKLSDPSYPFHKLATTADCRIRVDTVVEATDAEMQLLVTVLEGDLEMVFEQATSFATIGDVEQFGDDSNQFSVRVQKPFLASVIGKHDGVLLEAISDSAETSFSIKLPRDTPKRPVLDSLLSEYEEISLVAQRQTTQLDTLGTTLTEEILTDRQHEVLRAAFHGGYYETPKEVTGDDIAAKFDISNTAVYNHLQAAHRQILGATLGNETEYHA